MNDNSDAWLGWAIRFVLSGDNVVLPWLKPKEGAQ
jgi:hypothetical protein